MHDHASHFCGRTRREFLWQAGGGFAGVALANLLGDAWISGQAQAAHGLSPNLAADLQRPFLTHAPRLGVSFSSSCTAVPAKSTRLTTNPSCTVSMGRPLIFQPSVDRASVLVAGSWVRNGTSNPVVNAEKWSPTCFHVSANALMTWLFCIRCTPRVLSTDRLC